MNFSLPLSFLLGSFLSLAAINPIFHIMDSAPRPFSYYKACLEREFSFFGLRVCRVGFLVYFLGGGGDGGGRLSSGPTGPLLQGSWNPVISKALWYHLSFFYLINHLLIQIFITHLLGGDTGLRIQTGINIPQPSRSFQASGKTNRNTIKSNQAAADAGKMLWKQRRRSMQPPRFENRPISTEKQHLQLPKLKVKCDSHANRSQGSHQRGPGWIQQ